MNDQKKTILILGAGGMLGHVMLRFLADSPEYTVCASARSQYGILALPEHLRSSIHTGIDVENVDSLTELFSRVRPNVVINCIGLVKQLSEANDPLRMIPINALLPHRLARLCELAEARLIHVSTDCVFSGSRGMYTEDDHADATDLYGRSKYLGEVDYPHAITLRTSIIGHELGNVHGLVGWFLSQTGGVRGFTRAVFSGLPTVELARIVRDYILPSEELRGIYHVSVDTINKFDLLKMISEIYKKQIEIIPDSHLSIDRSLDSTRFRDATGYAPPSWMKLIQDMHNFG